MGHRSSRASLGTFVGVEMTQDSFDTEHEALLADHEALLTEHRDCIDHPADKQGREPIPTTCASTLSAWAAIASAWKRRSLPVANRRQHELVGVRVEDQFQPADVAAVHDARTRRGLRVAVMNGETARGTRPGHDRRKILAAN